jgi:hypothetical protein
METIVKNYTIKNWVEYTQCDLLPNAFDLAETTLINTYMGGHAVTVKTMVNDDGTGQEVRRYRVTT